MQMKSRGVGSTQYAYFLSSTLSDLLSAVRSGTQYFWKLLMISCYELLSACLALFVIRLSGHVCWKPARFRAELKRVCPWTAKNALLMSFLYGVNGNVHKYSLPWSTCFVAAVCDTQQHKRANYGKDEPGWGAGWACYLFLCLSFCCVQIWFLLCKLLCVWAPAVDAHSRWRKMGVKKYSECICTVSASR